MINAIISILTLIKGFGSRALIGLLAFSTLVALIEAAGVASVVPLVSFISSEEKINEEINLFGIDLNSAFFENLSEFNHAGILIVFLLAISVVLRAVYIYLQHRFCYILEHKISVKLLSTYLSHDYLWFASKDSADLTKSVLSEVSEFIDNGAKPVINMFAQVILALFVVGVVLSVNPLAAILSFSLLILIYIIIYTAIRGVLFNAGSERFEANQKRFRIVNEAFGAIKELKLYGLENHYSTRFQKTSHTFAVKRTHAQLMTFVPRYLVELLAFSGFAAVIVVQSATASGGGDLFPIMALYAMAGYKLMPAVQQVYSNIAQLRYSSKSVQSLLFDLQEIDQNFPSLDGAMRVSESADIRFDNVCFRYPSSNTDVIKGMNLHIKNGQTVAFVGATGSGKSTAVDLMLGIVKPVSGQILIGNTSLKDISMSDFRKKLGYVPQSTYFLNASISDNIKFFDRTDAANSGNVQHAAGIAQIKNFIEQNLPNGYSSVLGERGTRLSGGQLQRVSIARALYLRPQILVLDEATSALDAYTESKVIDAIRKDSPSATIIMVSHRLQSLKSCDRIFVFEDGSIVDEGTFEFLFKNSKIFQSLLQP